MCTSIKVVFVKHMHSKNVWDPYQNIFAEKKAHPRATSIQVAVTITAN